MKDIILIVCVYLVAVYIYILYIYISSLQTTKYSKVNVNVLVIRRTRRMDYVCVADPNGPAAFPKEHWLVLPIQNTPKLPMD